jgi:hypothetical protein
MIGSHSSRVVYVCAAVAAGCLAASRALVSRCSREGQAMDPRAACRT